MKKIIRLDIEYPKRVLRIDDAKSLEPQQVSFNIIASAMAATYGGQAKQMDKKQLRMWGKIQDRMLDDDGKPRLGDIELSEEQFSFVFDTVDGAQLPPHFAGVYDPFMDYIEAVKLKKDESPEEKV